MSTDSYTVEYSGGNVTSVFTTSEEPGFEYRDEGSYSLDDNGYYGGVKSESWGNLTAPDGTNIIYSASVECEGAITATFTWQPDNPDDTPPSNVVIAEEGNTGVSGSASLNAAPTTFHQATI